MTFNKPLIEEGSSIANAMFTNELDYNKLADTNPVEQETKVESEVIEEETKDQSNTQTQEDEEEVSEELIEDNDAPTEYEQAAQEMFSKGLIKELPEGVTDIPDLKTYNKVIEYNRKFVMKT